MSVIFLDEEQGIYSLPTFLPPGWRQVKTSVDGAAYRAPKGLTAIVSAAKQADGNFWLHVSIAHRDRLPTYEELKAAKAIFVGRQNKAIQIFPPESEHVDLHKNCLHLWSCLNGDPIPDFSHGGKTI